MGEAHDGLGGADWPDAVAAGEAGGDVLDDGKRLGAVVFELVPGLVERAGEAADLGVADGLLAAGSSGQFAPGQGGKGRLTQGLAGGPAVGVVPGRGAFLRAVWRPATGFVCRLRRCAAASMLRLKCYWLDSLG
jgi:hypothetical protein